MTDKRPAWNMPQAYIHESEYLRDAIEDLTLTANWEWKTERIMDWPPVENIRLRWGEWGRDLSRGTT
jgi:hypothetical protein